MVIAIGSKIGRRQRDRKVFHLVFKNIPCIDCKYNLCKAHHQIKVRSLFKDGKQTAGCTEFRTETGLCSLVSVQTLEHPAVCLPTLKRERTLV